MRPVFLFPGQGAFSPGVLSAARLVYPSVEHRLASIEEVCQRRFGRSLIKALWAPENSAQHLLSADPALLQLGIYTISVCALDILGEEGVEPALLMGHSFGEIAALVGAGVYTAEQGAEIVCDRVDTLLVVDREPGRMAALSADPDRVRALFVEAGADGGTAGVAIAVENHDRQTVVSGPEVVLQRVLDAAGRAGIGAQRLVSPHAFHHPALRPAAERFRAVIARHRAMPPVRPVHSPILGRLYVADDDFAAALARHLTLPVRFGAAVRQLHAAGHREYVECGALDTLCKLVIRVLGPGVAQTYAAFGTREDGLDKTRKIIARHQQGASMTISSPTETRSEFELFWNRHGESILSRIGGEIRDFLSRGDGIPAGVRPPDRNAEPAAVNGVAPVSRALPPADRPVPVPMAGPVLAESIPRPRLYAELVSLYAEAMEYPAEVFSETVELEAELGIDSVKQTELIARISDRYRLPPLPQGFRMSDYRTLGQVVDFVHEHQGRAVLAG